MPQGLERVQRKALGEVLRLLSGACEAVVIFGRVMKEGEIFGRFGLFQLSRVNFVAGFFYA